MKKKILAIMLAMLMEFNGRISRNDSATFTK